MEASRQLTFFRRVAAWGWMDAVLRQRARSVMARSCLSQQLPLSGSMLEVGAASGHLGEAVLRASPARRCVVADQWLAPPPRLAARMARRDFHAVAAGGEALPFADGRFDAAWTSFVLHQMPPDAQARTLSEMDRVVRPGGVVIVLETTPSAASIAAGRARGLHYRSAKDWRGLLAGQGWLPRDELVFSAPFPPTTLLPMQHRAFIGLRRPF